MTPTPTQYTVLVVSGHADAVRRFHVPRAWIGRAGWAAGAATLVVALLLVHYLSLLGTRSENRALRDENQRLRVRVGQVQDRVAGIAAILDRVEDYDAKLRSAVSQLQEPRRRLAIGPVGKVEEARPAQAPAPARDPDAELEGLPTRLTALQAEASRQESSLRELHDYFDGQRALVATTPSQWPTRGWVTSDFGVRLDPYSAERMMHRGLDIATPPGQPVFAPSDGTVSFAGKESGYGNVLVLDHGYGLKTRYGHLSEIAVKAGERVKRGARVGAVGNTGRSTGPHLHYEVRVDGVAENPRKFILE